MESNKIWLCFECDQSVTFSSASVTLSVSRVSMSCSPCGLTVGFLPPCMVCVCMCVWPRPCCRSLHVCLSLRLSPLLPFSLGQPAERLLPSSPAPEHRRALEGLLGQHAGHHPAPTPPKLHPGRRAWLGLNSFWVYYHFHWVALISCYGNRNLHQD